jgi:translation initiation factor IF-2
MTQRAVATALVQRGTLKIGDMFVAGSEYGRVRALFNDRGHRVTSGGPSEPLEVTGLKGTAVAWRCALHPPREDG